MKFKKKKLYVSRLGILDLSAFSEFPPGCHFNQQIQHCKSQVSTERCRRRRRRLSQASRGWHWRGDPEGWSMQASPLGHAGLSLGGHSCPLSPVTPVPRWPPPKSGAPPEPPPQSPRLAQMMFSGRLTQIRKMAPGGSDPFSKGWGQGRSIQRGCGAGYGRDLRVALA